jgi:hypothetical protein
MRGEQIIELVQKQRTQAGLRLEWTIPIAGQAGGESRNYVAFAKDEAQKLAWLKNGLAKGWKRVVPTLEVVAPPPKLPRQMFLQIGRMRYEVASIGEAVNMYCEARRASGLSASEMPRVQITAADGFHLYSIHYNGSVWDIDQNGRNVEVTDF